MAAKRNKLDREKARAFVAEKYLMQWTQQEMAAALNTTQQQVSYDIKAIQKAWRESSLIDMNEAKQQELERVDKLEREYWQAWEESKKDAETITKKGKGIDESGKPNLNDFTAQRKGQTGDPRFLAGIERCIERRCKLLGLDSPEKYDIKEETKLIIEYKDAE